MVTGTVRVVEGETRARRFPGRAGFAADGVGESFEAGGTAVPEVRCVKELHG
ncbi:hypothetical protein [Streptomyces prasinus]|uniref:hypothetical protein n=1 Tax=Streptomyces prasinus TaxID=67345 RepID=UPI0036CD609A